MPTKTTGHILGNKLAVEIKRNVERLALMEAAIETSTTNAKENSQKALNGTEKALRIIKHAY